MRKGLAIAGIIMSFALFSGFSFRSFLSSIFGSKTVQRESAAHIFNMANEARIKGDDTAAIEFYYKIIENYPGFKKYRGDILSRLGTLLYKTERYEEAERVLSGFIKKYKKHKGLKAAYEKLLYIYVQELNDDKKAREIRNLYAKKFGNGKILKRIDKTITILNGDNYGKSEILGLAPADIAVTGVKTAGDYDREFFPVLSRIKKEASSYNKKYRAERKKKGRKYHLYLSEKGKKTIRVRDSRNGYAPQWAWDSSFIAFVCMDWKKMERKIKIYNIKSRRTKTLFKGKNIEPVVCISPDGSKIIFGYMGRLWVSDRKGNVALLDIKSDVKNVELMAWERDGRRILIKRTGKKGKYMIYTLGRREIEIIK